MTSATRVSKLARARVSVARVSIEKFQECLDQVLTSTLEDLHQCLRV
jgi:hypothetical protein